MILKFLCTFLLLILSLTTILQASINPKKYVIATASTGGTFYPVGVGLAKLLSLKLNEKESMSFLAISSDGSFDNVRMLENKEVNFAMIQGLCGMMAWNGTHVYHNKPYKNLRSVSLLWQNVEHFMVRKEIATTGNILDLKNLYGQNFSMAENDSGSKVSAEIIMDTLGIDYTKMNLYYFGYNQSAVALQQGKIKGMNTPAGAPVAAVTSVCNAMGPLKVSLLEFSDIDLEKIQKQFPIWKRYVIKANTYPRQTKDINTIAQSNLLITDVDTPEDIVYLVTKTLYENLSFFNSVNKGTISLSLQNAIDGLNIPLHKGAIRYYQEMGITIPSHLLHVSP
ncbi:TAXI family TRAP transporter solute-binding subunit [Sulfurospirillum multivorans]|uniref:TRAP transporter solute receptor, TAXI family n=2 Tax=Sulfurospirillum multivorans TaxID=66821 RepID=A0AA86AMW8_SULMK|nr:TAXI family TRAP transporter solute-binding subunit [Sulfurospirillum multivorans]AHJ12707.1 TRAP transporter solute receptor, TAXI family [Sulfurospirillum multivorans DSM 12446]QEH06202.1 TRAP transporter solute receptor, TAXI family [Sulfurospirillum multivorans]